MANAATEKPVTLEEHTLAERQWQSYLRDRDAGHIDYVKEAQKYQNYYIGDQWEAAVLKKLESEGRPALTINLILSTINAALGEYSQRQARIGYKQKHGGAFETAQVLTKLAMHTLDNSDFDSLEWDMVVDGFISDRGYLDVRMDYEEHMRGEVKLSAIDPTEIVLDADAKEYDPQTWNKVTRTYWQTLDEIANDYGERKAKEVEALGQTGSHFSYDSFEYERRGFGDPDHHNREYSFNYTGEHRSIKNVRVISRQYRKLVSAYFYIDPRTGDMSEVPMGWSTEQRTFQGGTAAGGRAPS